MTSERAIFDRELTDYVERFQHRQLIAVGLDPDRFARRTDADEVSLPIRLAAHGLRLVFQVVGRREQAQQLGEFLGFARARAREAPRLRRLISQRTARDPAPASRYQRLDDHSFLIEMQSIVRAALERLPPSNSLRAMIVTIDSTILATAPIGRCNAFIRSSADGRFFAIILDDEIVRLAVQMGYFFADLVVEKQGAMILDSRRAEELLADSAGPIAQFDKIIGGFVEDGSSLMAIPPARPSSFAIDVMTTFAQLAVIFVLAHEYSHAMLGHLEDRRGQLALMEEDETVEEEARSSIVEAQADANAWAVVQCVCRSWGCDPALAGPAAISILSVYDAVYRSIAEATGGDGSARLDAIVGEIYNHPAPGERLRRLIDESAANEAWAFYVARGLTRYRAAVRPSHIHTRWRRLVSALDRA